ncbi:M20/M25/M40 family metallo-hydrolase [Photobacterium phosphoreum]|jgi:glutamate carboxypeptidase|uniref:M20/M25/M40 family metallo-hydrolase n=1 Tax=Photobacterium phosphoreum TaxID=659 RepID=A0AAW4ZUE3_PHOPO|nr:M20 family metallopeptidase [Photobacterium phosphoreum]MCD9464548.1 peptidase M20 [Photobacterium phosphoreum]MCD9470915.1 peptidase M20 [Photobacterium phosphoreum]MCD9476605.1 M20/M25/M40 family metallo-hydrolase [Photobacterium phosphoreum]MCD9491014.1 M20/M25/M40 family metallo-hydrolase [Photobacterium phosphoreum]MCD9503221.1 M20/M25/M40 family metallo-hydrolase [Photobacterium phosphoreum]
MSFSLNNYLEELRPLINIDCGTLTVDGIDVVATLMAQKYLDLGWNVKRIDCGIAGTGLEVRNKPQADHIDVMLIGHMDTVFPVGTAAARPMTHDDERAYGPGVSDMKSGLLSVVYALRDLDPTALDALSICVCMNPDEEIGSLHSETWLKSVAINAKHVLVAEAARADGSLVKARKGMARYRLSFHGKAAHAGNEPQNGRSAITEMAHWILAINAMTDFESGTTLNAGVVSGGAGANIVPDFAEVVVDVRFWDNDEYAAVDAQIRTLTETPFIDGVTITVEREAHKPSMVPSPQTEVLMAQVEAVGKELGIDITWQAVGGGSDANLTAVLGIPTLDGLGPIGAGFHSEDEWLDLASIEPRIRLLQQVLVKIAQQ